MAAIVKDGYNPEVSISDNQNGLSVTRSIYVLENNDYADGMEYRILNLSGIPQKGDAYPDATTNMVVTSREATPYDASQEGDFANWIVTITYAPPEEDEGTGTTPEGFARNLQVSARSQQYERALERAYDENNELNVPVESTTNEPLIGVTYYYTNTLVTVSQNIANFDFNWVKRFVNTTNAGDTSIVGISAAAGQAKILELDAQSQTDELGNSYYSTTVTIEITDEDFNIKPMNRGFMEIDFETGEKLYILKEDISDETGDTGKERIDEPAKLDEDSVPITDDTAYYLSFKAYLSEDWGVLNIPTSQP